MTLLLDSTRLEVALSAAERALAFHKGNVLVERPQIAKVQLTDDAWNWLRGVAGPGTHVRGVVAMGTWKSAGAADFVIVRRRRPGVVIDLDGHEDYERLILTTRHGLQLVQALRLDDVSSVAADVVAIATGTIPVQDAPKPSRPAKKSPRPAPAT